MKKKLIYSQLFGKLMYTMSFNFAESYLVMEPIITRNNAKELTQGACLHSCAENEIIYCALKLTTYKCLCS